MKCVLDHVTIITICHGVLQTQENHNAHAMLKTQSQTVKTEKLYNNRHFLMNWNVSRASSALLRRRPEHGPPLVRTTRAAGRVCGHRTIEVVWSAWVDILSVDILGAGAEGGSVLATSIFLLEAVEFEFYRYTVSQRTKVPEPSVQAEE